MQTEKLLLELFETGVEAVKPHHLINQHCRLEGELLYVGEAEYDLSRYQHIYVFGSGKASASMAKALEDILDKRIDAGLVVSPVYCKELRRIDCMISDHPIPTQRCVDGARALMEQIKGCEKDDLYIYLLSGGSSSLIENPVEGITLRELQETTDLMLNNALSISEINTVRKHLSSIKGGQLGRLSEAEGIVLCVSDVIGDDLYNIGSAPLYADSSTYADALQIIEAYDLKQKLPSSVYRHLQEGAQGLWEETPKVPASHIKHYLIGTNALARQAIYERAVKLGIPTVLIEEPVQGEVHEASKKMYAEAMACEEQLVIFGGEVTVRVQGNGKGGRNQHGVLEMLRLSQEDNSSFSYLSGGTDGIDGNSDAAGAYMDPQTLHKASALGLDIESYLETFDSYHFFQALKQLVMTGPTGTNVMDIALFYKEI